MKDLQEIMLDMIKQELIHIESSIRKIDDIENSVKNWAILTWGGSIALLMKEQNIRQYILITAILPIAFFIVDARWRKVQRSFIYRLGLISKFINKNDIDQMLCMPLDNDFILLDPRAKLKHEDDYQEFVGIKTTLRFATVSCLYIAMSLMSVSFGIIFLFKLY